MSEDVREMLVGAAALIVLGVLVTIIVGGRSASRHDPGRGYVLYATFDRVDGVDAGAAVRVAGIDVGTVEALELRPDYRVRMTMRLDRVVALPADSSAMIETDGLFGGKAVRLEAGGDVEVLKDQGVIEFTQGSLVVSDLLDQIIAQGRAARSEAAAAPPVAGGGR